VSNKKTYDEMTEEERLDFDDRLVRNHIVDLERVQRIHLGVDSEPMEFTADTIADMVQDIADNSFTHEAFTLHAIARALRGLDDHHILVLRQKKRGKWESPTEHEKKHNREMSWLWTLGAWEHDGMKTEAAVARIAELANVSRATVFQGIRNAEAFLEHCREIIGDRQLPEHLKNPRPSKGDNC
jgi:hypothetical protein